MNDPDLSRNLEAGLRAGFGPPSTAAHGSGGALIGLLRESIGEVPELMLREESNGADSDVGLVDPWSSEAESVASEPGRGRGRYEVAGELARGGIGVVLKGRDRDLGREVALKVLRAEHASNPAMVRRLVEEAQIGGQLQHPGILPVYELGIDSARRPFFAMKLVRGRSLSALLDERDSPTTDRRRFLTIFEAICQAVAYTHARGVIHRDLKPSNVMVGAFGEVQVVDWGLAKVLARGGSGSTTPDSGPSAVATVRTGDSDSQSEAGSVLGTPSYMAPEQARGEVDSLDERCDVFALGAILCEILTGQPPFVGGRDEVLRQSRAGDLDDALTRLQPGQADADPELLAIARRCLDPIAERRYREAGQVAREIGSHLASLDERARIAERDAATARAVARTERRLKWLSIATAALIIAALAIIGNGSLRLAREQARAADAELAAERERQERLQGALQVLMAAEEKGNFLIVRAGGVRDEDAAKWAEVMATCRAVAERSAEATPDGPGRERARRLVEQLREKEAELRQRAEKAAKSPREPGEP